MGLDSTVTHAIANDNEPKTAIEMERFSSHCADYSAVRSLTGIRITKLDEESGLGIEDVSHTEGQTTSVTRKASLADSTSWCYLYMHNRKVPGFEKSVEQYNLRKEVQGTPDEMHRCFVHKTTLYTRKPRGGVSESVHPTISGLVFLQGTPKSVQAFLDVYFPPFRLCKNRATGKAAIIPDTQMQPFMKIMKENPTYVRILQNPIEDYAANHLKLRILTGVLAGQEGYIIRICRDRKFVMDLGGMAVAVGGIHKETFAEVKSIAEQMKLPVQ